LEEHWWPLRDKWCRAYWGRVDAWDTADNCGIERCVRTNTDTPRLPHTHAITHHARRAPRYHGDLKRRFLKNKHNKRVDVLIVLLRGKVSRWYKARCGPNAVPLDMSRRRKILEATALRAHKMYREGKVTKSRNEAGERDKETAAKNTPSLNSPTRTHTLTHTLFAGDFIGVVASFSATKAATSYIANLTNLTCTCDARSTLLCHHLLALCLAYEGEVDIDITQERSDVQGPVDYNPTPSLASLSAVVVRKPQCEPGVDTEAPRTTPPFNPLAIKYVLEAASENAPPVPVPPRAVELHLAGLARCFAAAEAAKRAGEVTLEEFDRVAAYARSWGFTLATTFRTIRNPIYGKSNKSKQRQRKKKSKKRLRDVVPPHPADLVPQSAPPPLVRAGRPYSKRQKLEVSGQEALGLSARLILTSPAPDLLRPAPPLKPRTATTTLAASSPAKPKTRKQKALDWLRVSHAVQKQSPPHKQGTHCWHMMHAGRITGAGVKPVVVSKTGVHNAARSVLSPRRNFSSAAMKRGRALEDPLKKHIETTVGHTSARAFSNQHQTNSLTPSLHQNNVEFMKDAGLVVHSTLSYLAFSADGITKPVGQTAKVLYEFKTWDGQANNKPTVSKHNDQIQLGLFVNQLSKAVLVAYEATPDTVIHQHKVDATKVQQLTVKADPAWQAKFTTNAAWSLPAPQHNNTHTRAPFRFYQRYLAWFHAGDFNEVAALRVLEDTLPFLTVGQSVWVGKAGVFVERKVAAKAGRGESYDLHECNEEAGATERVPRHFIYVRKPE
jgi:hypothetical protein